MWDNINNLEKAKSLILNPHYQRTSDFSADDVLLSMTDMNGKDVLDFGCGVGRNALWINKNFKVNSLTMFDHPNMLAMAREYMGDVYDLTRTVPYPVDGLKTLQFDVIVACFVFQHIRTEELKASLRVLSECLKDGGVLIVHSRGYNDFKGNNWKLIDEHFVAETPLNIDDDTENHQRVRFIRRDRTADIPRNNQ